MMLPTDLIRLLASALASVRAPHGATRIIARFAPQHARPCPTASLVLHRPVLALLLLLAVQNDLGAVEWAATSAKLEATFGAAMRSPQGAQDSRKRGRPASARASNGSTGGSSGDRRAAKRGRGRGAQGRASGGAHGRQTLAQWEARGVSRGGKKLR